LHTVIIDGPALQFKLKQTRTYVTSEATEARANKHPIYNTATQSIYIYIYTNISSGNQQSDGERRENWEGMPSVTTWYCFIETRGQKWAVFDGKYILRRDAILRSFSVKFRTQPPCKAKDKGNVTERKGVRNAITNILKSGIWIVRNITWTWKINYDNQKILTTANR